MRPSLAVMQLADGEAGIFQSLEAMRRGVLKEQNDPHVQETVSFLAQSCFPSDASCKSSRIFDFVKTRMDYVPDPDDVEAVGLASFHLANISARGTTEGDCDDGAVLVATLALAAGLPARFAVASFRPDRELHHVWAEVNVAGEWRNLDTFRSERLQTEPTRIVYRVI